MNYKIWGLLAVGLMARPLSAIGQATTYSYQGAPLSANVDVSPPPGANSFTAPPNIAVDTLSGFIILSAPLGDNLNNVSVTPLYISIFSDSPLFKGDFAFSTNSKGAIDGWSISLNGDIPGPGGYEESATSIDKGGVGGDAATMSTNCTAFFSSGSPQTFSCGSSGSNTTPGVWTSPAAQAPEIDPASAISGLTMLLGGVVVLRGRRKLES